MAGESQTEDEGMGACQASQHSLSPLCQGVPEVGGRGPFQCQAGQVDSGINQEEEDCHDTCDGVELPRKEHDLQRAQGECIPGMVHQACAQAIPVHLGYIPGV